MAGKEEGKIFKEDNSQKGHCMSNEPFLEFLKSRLNYCRKDLGKEQISAPPFMNFYCQ